PHTPAAAYPRSLHDALPILARRVETHVADVEHLQPVGLLFVGEGDAPQCGTNARDELAQPEGLRDVVVGTHLESDNGVDLGIARSEEHTSELQSRFDLVCRL